MREYGFSPVHILPCKDKIFDFFHIQENTGQWKPAFSHILCSVTVFSESYARFWKNLFLLILRRLCYFNSVTLLLSKSILKLVFQNLGQLLPLYFKVKFIRYAKYHVMRNQKSNWDIEKTLVPNFEQFFGKFWDEQSKVK